MKSKRILIALLNASLFVMPACKKSSSSPTTNSTLTQTVEATIAKNTSYSYTLPTSSASYAITSASAHAASSAINIDATGNLVYNYTAATDFIGIDTVIVSELDSNCMHGDSTHFPPPPCDSTHRPPFDSTHMPPVDTSRGHGPCGHPHGPRPGRRQIIFHINVKDGAVAQ